MSLGKFVTFKKSVTSSLIFIASAMCRKDTVDHMLGGGIAQSAFHSTISINSVLFIAATLEEEVDKILLREIADLTHQGKVQLPW